MKLSRLFNRKTKELQEQLAHKDQTISHLSEELQSKTDLIEHLTQAYGAHDLSSMFDGLRNTLSEQINRTRDHGAQQYWDLLGKLERGREQIQNLQSFISVTMRHIGRMEGQAKTSNQITLSSEEGQDLIHAAELYQRTLQQP